MNLVLHSSLPRSGSTLLQSLLGQCPSNHCTPTSGLVELVVQARNTYGSFEEFQSQGIFTVAPRIRSALRGMVEGYYATEQGRTVFEKARGWLAYLELIEEILERPVKVVCCVRDVREIVASFERLHRCSSLTKADAPPAGYLDSQTLEGRVRQWLAPGGIVGLAIHRLRDVFDRGLDSRLVIVPYTRLVADPVDTVLQVSVAVGAVPFVCDPQRVLPETREDDGRHGMRLHDVRPTVTLSQTDWRALLPERLGNQIHKQFPFIQELAGARP